MTQVTVKFVNEKEGSKWWSIKTPEDKWFSFDKTKLSFTKGRSYDVVTTSTEKDGRTYYTIVEAKEVGGGSSGNGSSAISGDRWWMPFVSNTVAHAITAGHIGEPLAIKAWAAAAKQAALEIEQPAKKIADDLPDF